MCLDTEMIVGLFLVWIVAPLLLFGAVIFAAVKAIYSQNTKLK